MRYVIAVVVLLSCYELIYAQTTKFEPGTIGVPQQICYNTAPAPLTQVTTPSGGTGVYTYQWQSSPDNSTWTDIAGATSTGYSPPALTSSTYYRRTVSSGSYSPVNSNTVQITVSPQVTLSQLHDNISIESGTSTNFNVVVTGGTSPFTVNYTRNGVAQMAINNYVSGTNISTGILTTGDYIYSLTSTTDAGGCSAQSLGTNITVTVTDEFLTYAPIATIFSSEIPITSSHDTRYDLGTEFQTLSDGFITKVRLYSHINEGGDHIVRLWRLNGSSYGLIAGPYTWNFSAGYAGWREYELPTAIEITANTRYIISITNSTDYYYVKSEYFSSGTSNDYVQYLRGLYTISIGSVPSLEYHASCYFRDIVFAVNLTAGSIGTAQTICYNNTPAALTQVTTPSGGTGVYTYQWQSSPDNSTWTDIAGATSTGYLPPALTSSTYYRRTVSSGSYTPVNSTAVLITVSPVITLAQLHDNITIPNNTSANINVAISGGTSPFTVNYTRNGVAQMAINNYVSGTNISTGVLTTGTYVYALTSVTDANGCLAQSLGTNITVTVTVNGDLTSGTIGTAQTVCYNTAPAPLTQVTTPSGGTGVYTYQWQSSPDNSTWTDIAGATSTGYSPPALTSSTYYRRTVSSGSYSPVNSNTVQITVSPQVTLSQLHDNISIESGTSTNFNVVVTGGTSPFTVNYTRNGVAQMAINNYVSGTNISTGILTTGDYIYSLTSTTDAGGCSAQSLGTNITVTVTDEFLTYAPIATIFSSEIPITSSHDTRYDLGTEFQTLSDGFITKVRLYSHINEGGDHIVRLWRLNGSSYGLIAGPYTWNFSAGYAGWREYELPTAIEITANTRYIISITNSTDYYYVKSEYFSSGTSNDYVQYLRGLYTISIGSVPSLEYHASCYFRDIVFAVNLTAGSIGTAQTICYNNTPAALTQVTTPSGGTGVYTYQWQSSPDNSTWTDIAGATSTGYLPPALTSSTYYRRTVSSGSYTPVNSTAVLITVSPVITLAQLHDNITIPSNTSANINVAISGGTSPFTVNYTRNGVAQMAINNYVSGTNISTGVLTTGTYVYALTSVTDANGCLAQSLGTNITVTVTVNGDLTSGTIGTAQTVCYNTAPAPLTQVTTPSGGTGVYTYQWQSSPDNSTWTDIAGATSTGYSPPALTSSTYYRRTVSSGSYTPINSTAVLITVSPVITLAQLHDNITIPSNTSANINVAISGGTSPFTVNYTRNGVAQMAINNYVSGTNISTGILTTGDYIYSLTSTTDAGGCSAQSLGTNITVTVTVNGDLTSGTIGTAQTICYNNTPAALTQVTTPSGGTGVYTYQWQSSPDNSTWTDIAGATSTGYSPPALTSSTYYRRTVSSGSYTPVNSTAVLITVSPVITLAQLHDNITIPSNTSANINVAISGGTSPFTVNYTRNGVAQMAINNYVSGTNISTGVLTTGTYVYALTSVTDANGCLAQSLGTNITVTVTVNGDLTSGTIGTAQTVCYNTAPAPLTQVTTPSGGTGVYTYQWQSSPDNSTWTDIAGATSTGYSPPALTSSTYYRRTVSSGSYSPVNSNTVQITVSPQVTLSQLHDNISIESGTSTNFNVVVTGGTSPFTVNYTRNGVAQMAINNYVSGTNISTGILTTGDYIYSLTSTTDAGGCSAQSLGTNITVTVTDEFLTYAPIATIFSSEIPITSSHDTRYDLGTEFQTLSDGFITKVRLYSHINEGGDHIVRLWRLNGSSYGLIAGPYTWNFSAGYAGWREYELPTAIEITANTRYIISITNSTDYYYVKSEYFSSGTSNDYVQYLRGLYTISIGSVPSLEYHASCYFRDIVFAVNLTAGSIGTAQTICYNNTPAALTQVTTPSGGTGVYTYQWQSSPDNSTWTDIAGATSTGYSPPALTSSTYYRRTVSSGSYTPVNSTAVLITVSPVITLAQLHDNITIPNNTSANINVAISGGTSPFTVNYTRNGVAQMAINNYVSGTNISTGILTTGDYIYSLTSTTDAGGCFAQSLGTSITITVVTENQNPQLYRNKALAIVNSLSFYYSDFTNFIIPYLDNFGIPYEVCDVSSTSLAPLSDYGVLIFGHSNVYSSDYPIAQLESAVSGGVGLYSFDPHLFDFASGFNTLITQKSVNSSLINISNYTHYITIFHTPDTNSPLNNTINLLNSMSVVQNSTLVNSTDLVSLGSLPLLQVTNYGNGKIVRWNGYDWVFDNILGPVYGMDDLIWRGIVWSAREPFVMQGLPPMITMRVDDADAGSSELVSNFAWISICNEYGIIPWLGTFNNSLSSGSITALKTLLDNNQATASPHAFTQNSFIYFNHDNLDSFDAAANTRQARQFYAQNDLKMSKYILPHYYEISSSALPEVHNMGGEFIGTHMLPDHSYGTSWINNGPFRINRNGVSAGTRPVYYGDYNIFSGLSFFNCLTEIRDDGGYEWYPDNDVSSTSARGIRHLRRSLSSMVLSCLFTHEYFFDNISVPNFRQILYNITSSISEYNPEYTSTDYAIQYIRAKKDIKITNVVDNLLNIEISYSGNNDMVTKCYLFTGQDNQITYRLIYIPQAIGSGTVSVLK